MQLTSAAFTQVSAIPAQFMCDGENTSPEFSWKEAPKETKAFALVIHDPDAPRGDSFAHWVLYNIHSSKNCHLPPSHKAVVWGWRLAVPLWSRTAVGCGRPRMTDRARHFN